MEETELMQVLKDIVYTLDELGLNKARRLDAPPGTTEMIAIQLIDLNKTMERIAAAIEGLNAEI